MKYKLPILTFIVTFTLLLSSVTRVLAAGYHEETPLEWAQAVEENCGAGTDAADESCGEKYHAWAINSLANGASRAIMGLPSTEPAKSFSGSALGYLTGYISYMTFQPPASTSYFAYDLLQNARLVKPAYAQGIGYSGLFPILEIWKVFRNISYVILVLVMIVVGFMVMFRMKINPQTAITIQSALPNIILTILLITFSYAIAGLLIDLTYFLIYLVVYIFGQANDFNSQQIQDLNSLYTNANAWSLLTSVVQWDYIKALPQALFGVPVITSLAGVGTTALLPWGIISIFTGGALLPAAGAIALFGFIGAAIPFLVIALALFFSFLRIFFIMLNAYIQILIAIIFAPLQLLLGAIPGNNMFGSWLKGLIGNLIIFPAAVAIFMIASTITKSIGAGSGQSMWAPPFVVGPTAGSGVLVGLIGLGVAILAPTLLSSIKQSIAGKPFLPITPGAIFAPTTGAAGSLIGAGAQLGYYYRIFQGRTLLESAMNKFRTPGGKPKETPGQQLTQGATQIAGVSEATQRAGQ